MASTLFDILDYESEDASGRKCARTIKLYFFDDQLHIESRDSAFGDPFTFFLTHGALEKQIPAARKAKNFVSFCQQIERSTDPDAIPVKKILNQSFGALKKDEALFYDALEAINELRGEDLTDLLMNNGLDVNFVNQIAPPPTLLYLTVEKNNVSMCRLLLDHGADPNVGRNGIGQTALHRAALRDYVEIAGLLLDHGAKIDEPRHDGTTPLEMAVGLGRKNTVCLLLDRGADPRKATKDLFDLAAALLKDEQCKKNPDEETENFEGIVERLNKWRGEQAEKAHSQNLARLDRILGRKKG